ncbi:MAG: Rid family hydrolase [Acidobacteriota bacterium]
MQFRPFLAIAIAAGLVWVEPAAAQRNKKNKKEEITQTLEVLPDPPSAVKVDTTRLVFHVSSLTGKGLLSQQVRDGIKELWRKNQGASIVRLRAWVAGTGDMRRVANIVSEMFADKRQQLPVVNVVQVGLLPMDGAQVLLEATSVAKKVQNPHGLAFISGQAGTAPIDPANPSMKVALLAAKAVTDLKTALAGVQLEAKDVVRVSCLATSLEDYSEARQHVAIAFPQAALAFVQSVRSPTSHVVECEAVARLKADVGAPAKFVQPPGLTASPNFTHVVLVGAPQVVLTTTQLAFRAQDADVRLAFSRLQGILESAGSGMDQVLFSSIYPLSNATIAKVRAIRFEFYDKSKPPASTLVLFEGLPSLDASFGVDVVALPK